MHIVLDADEVILDTLPALKQFYIETINPQAKLLDGRYIPEWSDDESINASWSIVLKQFRHSSYFTKIKLIDGAYEGIHQLKRSGHKISVLSAGGNEPDVTTRRINHLRSLIGNDVFKYIICLDPYNQKKEALLNMGADVLIDDGPSNIVSALELGIHGIWKRCAPNLHIINAVFNGEIPKTSWPVKNFELLRRKAIIAGSWPQIVNTIQTLR